MRLFIIRLVSFFSLLAVMHTASPAMALVVERDNRATSIGLPVAAGGVLVGTLLVPVVANSFVNVELPYWQLSLANFVTSSITGVAVALGTSDTFDSDQSAGYLMTSLFAPIALSALTSWAMYALLGESPQEVAAVDPYIPAVAMVVTPQEQSLLLGWQF